VEDRGDASALVSGKLRATLEGSPRCHFRGASLQKARAFHCIFRRARAKGRLRQDAQAQPLCQEAHLVALHQAGAHTSAELAELFSVARSTGLPRERARTAAPAEP
jgi:hypothetical protein